MTGCERAKGKPERRRLRKLAAQFHAEENIVERNHRGHRGQPIELIIERGDCDGPAESIDADIMVRASTTHASGSHANSCKSCESNDGRIVALLLNGLSPKASAFGD
jgi:hypothetical protein